MAKQMERRRLLCSVSKNISSQVNQTLSTFAQVRWLTRRSIGAEEEMTPCQREDWCICSAQGRQICTQTSVQQQTSPYLQSNGGREHEDDRLERWVTEDCLEACPAFHRLGVLPA